MTEGIPNEPLSEALERQLEGRAVRAAVFTTYVFDPGFFEQEVLPVLFPRAGGHASRGRLPLLYLEDALKDAGPVAVYYDRRALDRSTDSPVLDVRRIPLERHGVFHPKLVLVLVENEADEDEPATESLVVGVLSANLNERGWWENVECAWLDEVEAGQKCSYRQDLMKLFNRIRHEDATEEDHEALGTIHDFVRRETTDAVRRKRGGVVQPRLFVGQMPFPEFVAETVKIPASTYNLEIISPFFDDTDDASAFAGLVEALAPKKTRVHLPRAEDGSALCREAFYDTVAAIPSAQWATLPANVLRRGQQARAQEAFRFAHAKVYRLWSKAEGREFLAIGSVNLTHAAHSHIGAGNMEAAVVFENPAPGPLGFWLTALDADEQPTTFQEQEPGEPDPEPDVAPLSVRYFWQSGVAEAFWEGKDPPGRVTLSSAGVPVADFPDLEPREWTPLPPSGNLAQILRSTSFLDVSVDGKARGTILVREEEMAHRPSVLLSFTAEEILRYWALLSEEQRQAFLESKVAEAQRLREAGVTSKADPLSTEESLFDRFAGIFHAFSELERQMRGALDADQEQPAVYRLFGAKYDSLPHLLDKVAGESEGDWVNRYVTILTAKQMIDRLTKEYPEFFEAHSAELRELRRRLRLLDDMRSAVLREEPDREAFLSWFERQFMDDAPRPPQEAR